VTTAFRSLVSMLLFALLLFAFAAGALAASSRLAVQRHADVRMSPVTISITTTNGTTWGAVTTRYTFRHQMTRRTCSAASCTLQVPKGVMVHLSQVPTTSGSWPFKDWQISTHHRTTTVMTTSLAVKVTGSMTVTAVYVLHML
jgi:hypothetical protein